MQLEAPWLFRVGTREARAYFAANGVCPKLRYVLACIQMHRAAPRACSHWLRIWAGVGVSVAMCERTALVSL